MTLPDNSEDKTTVEYIRQLSRIVIQKILASDVVGHLSQSSIADMNKLFISDKPERDINLNFKLQPESRTRVEFSNSVVDVNLKWSLSPSEIIDDQGNVWSCMSLDSYVGYSSQWGLVKEDFFKRANIIYDVNLLLESVHAIVPEPIRILLLNNQQRQEREESRTRENCMKRIENFIFSLEGRAYRSGLRKGGRNRVVLKDVLADITPGKYTIYEVRKPTMKRTGRSYLFVSSENVPFHTIQRLT